MDDVGFEMFWGVYPRKTAKTVARRAWKKLAPSDALLGTMIRAIGRQKESDQWKRGIIPHASTWLNQHRWEDEVAAASPLSKQGQETASNLTDWLSAHKRSLDAPRLASGDEPGAE